MTSPTSEPDVLGALREAVGEPGGDTVEVTWPELPDLASGSVDRVVLTSPLDGIEDPLVVLRTMRRWLRPTGTLVCAVTNSARPETLVQLLRGDPRGPLDGGPHSNPQHLYGYATAFKVLLEAGYSPDIASLVGAEPEADLLDSARPLLDHLRVAPERAAKHLAVQAYVYVARPITGVDEGPEDVPPLSFVACVNDDRQLRHNLAASPVFGPGSPHELLLYRGMDSAAQGLNRGMAEARHDLVVLVQQDIYVPSWWPSRLAQQWRAASAAGTPAIAGPFGVRYREGGRTHVGHAIDRDYLLRTPHELPVDVDGLDELLMVVPRDVPIRFDPALGWHLYGTDFVLQARAAGLRAAVLDVPCHHNSLFTALDDAYHHAESVLAAKWPRELPILTNSSTIDHDPRDARVAALESLLSDTQHALEEAQAATAAAQRAAAKRETQLRRMRGSRSWRWGRRLARLAGRR